MERVKLPPRKSSRPGHAVAEPASKEDYLIKELVVEALCGGSVVKMYAGLLIGALLDENPHLHQRWGFLAAHYPLPSQLRAEPAEPETITPQQGADYLLRRYHQVLSARERDFLSNIRKWKGDLSEKQMNWFEAILDRINKLEKPASRT
jgi:hypothetical protein